ncbi:1324_t:CDS:2, partial [Entrophospora sp. SA101]
MELKLEDFTIRDTVNTLGTRNTKSNFNEAHEIVRHHVLEKKWQKDNEFGSLSYWFESHVKVAPTPIKPLFPINGIDDFDSSFFKNNQNLVGQVSALFAKKNEFINNILPDRPCPYNRANLHQCTSRKIFYEEYIISLPYTLIFEITQRDGANYHSSEQLDFPFQLCYQENEITIEYTLTACVYSTSSSGQHFYSEVIRSFNNQSGVYKYDDLNEGTAVLISNDPTTLSGYKPQTVLVAYKLNDFNRTFMEKLNNHNINILDEKIHSGIDLIEYFTDKSHQYFNKGKNEEEEEEEPE